MNFQVFDELSERDWRRILDALNEAIETDKTLATARLFNGEVQLTVLVHNLSVTIRCGFEVKEIPLWLHVDWYESEDATTPYFYSAARFRYDEAIGGYVAKVKYDTQNLPEDQQDDHYCTWCLRIII